MKTETRVKLITVELQNGHREFQTESDIQLRTDDYLWYKENLINIAVTHLPHYWKYMAWIDADIEFSNKNWAQETIDQLQTYKIVQLFSHAIDLGEKHETLQVHTGLMYQYINGDPIKSNTYNGEYHPGYAWAIRREAYDAIGGLMDFPILGSADRHMGLAFIGLVEKSLNHKLHENYKLLCRIYQEKCDKHIKKNVGYVHGTILHHFHSCKKLRGYSSRWAILVDNKFDPLRDIVKNSYGLWVIDDKKIK
jgi:hypothetical protein